MDFNVALDNFLTHITDAKEADRVARFAKLRPTVYTIETGIKNIRVVEQDSEGNHRSVFCFIRKEDGAVLKAAGWKAPAKHARGTIYTDNPQEYGVGVYGANYLK
jgi:hypothetical protein